MSEKWFDKFIYYVEAFSDEQQKDNANKCVSIAIDMAIEELESIKKNENNIQERINYLKNERIKRISVNF